VQFGRVTNIEGIEFALPQDLPVERVAPPTVHTCEVLAGLPVWAKKSFVGPIYPAGTRSADMLAAYGARFPAIELNPTHYSVPDVARIEAWCAQVPPHFKFCPKVPQAISHSREPDVPALRAFAARMQTFGKRLGPCFMQFPDYADTSWRRTVFELTRAFPLPLAVELRHPSWFQDKGVLAKFTAYLASRDIAFVITDTPGRRDVLHMANTASFAFVRFLGNALHPSDFARIDAWAARLAAWAPGLSSAYFFLHQQDEVQCLPLYERLVNQLPHAVLPPAAPNATDGAPAAP
jgi:uncharacterized protein YecE (DUF72 family)